ISVSGQWGWVQEREYTTVPEGWTALILQTNTLLQKTPYCVPTHLAQQRDPWNRLHGTPTLASIRREIWYTEPEVSKDSLDFNLSALYNHHKDLLKDKSKVVLHKETLFDDHGQLKGLEPVKERTALSIQQPTSKGISVRHWVNPVRESIHNIEGAIGKHKLQTFILPLLKRGVRT
uniref:Cilia and flagella associated protein 276 n=1 Tax=Podarcis muralis TaxID=64176 RepID=A0A670J9F4_PODMU